MNGDIRVPQTVINQFIYAGNNPVMFTDPSGAFIAALIGLIYEAIAAAISAIYTYIANLMSAIMTADWKGIYDGITSFAGLKDQALGAGRESFFSGMKSYVGLPDMREVMGKFGFGSNDWEISRNQASMTWESDLGWDMRKMKYEINSIFKEIGGKSATITFTNNGVHSPNSLHYSGNAADFRTRDFSTEQVNKIVNKLKTRLGSNYDVLYESGQPHIHIEFDPKQ